MTEPTPSRPIFKDAYGKIRRAQQHVAELEQIATEWTRTSTPQWDFEVVEQPDGTFAIVLEVETPTVPELCGFIIGDAIHNLRVSLDLMASELVRMNGHSDTNTYFPFCDGPDDLDKMIKKRRFHLAGKDAVSLLKDYAPYKGGNLLLRAIHDLDIQDKHRCLIPHAASHISPSFEFRDVGGKLMPVPVEGEDTTVESELIFPSDGPFAGVNLIQGLHDLVQLTTGILDAFADLYTSSGGK